MRSQLAIVENDISEDDHMFSVHATQIRGVLNEMKSRQDFKRTMRVLDSVVAHFATLALGACSLKEPKDGWSGAIWQHLLAMSDLKSHTEALAEARRIRAQFCQWERFPIL